MNDFGDLDSNPSDLEESLSLEDIEENVSTRDLRIRRNARSIFRRIDYESATDLSLHLYAAHLSHRIGPATTENQPAKTKGKRRKNRNQRVTEEYLDSDEDELIVKGQLITPRRYWTRWPAFILDDNGARVPRVPVPKVEGHYVSVEDPKDPKLQVPTMDDEIKSKKYPQAKKIMAFEVNAAFQRIIYDKIEARRAKSEKIQAVVEPEVILPLQSQAKVFELIDCALQNIADSTVNTRYRKVNWQIVLSRHAKVGESFERCKRLFFDNNQQAYDDNFYRACSVMSNTFDTGRINGQDKGLASKMEHDSLASKVSAISSNDELLYEYLLPDNALGAESFKAKQHIEVAKRHLKDAEKTKISLLCRSRPSSLIINNEIGQIAATLAGPLPDKAGIDDEDGEDDDDDDDANDNQTIQEMYTDKLEEPVPIVDTDNFASLSVEDFIEP